MGGRPGAPRALAVPTGPLGSAGPPQTAETIFSCILERLTENWLWTPGAWTLELEGHPVHWVCTSLLDARFRFTHTDCHSLSC